jgi:hypothetical protein
VALALGEVKAWLQRVGRDRLRLWEHPSPQRQRRRRSIDRLLEEALEVLPLATAGGERAAYARALVAYLEDRLDEAGELATTASAREPWLYEARILRADVTLRRSERAADRENPDEVLDLLGSAREEYRHVLAVAPSAAGAWYGVCETWACQLATQAPGEPVADAVAREALEACRTSAVAEPGGVYVHLRLAEVAMRLAMDRAGSGEEERGDAIELAVAQAREAWSLEPGAGDAARVLTAALRERQRLVGSDDATAVRPLSGSEGDGDDLPSRPGSAP